MLGDPRYLEVQGGLRGLPLGAGVVLPQPDHLRVPGPALEAVSRGQDSVGGDQGPAAHHAHAWTTTILQSIVNKNYLKCKSKRVKSIVLQITQMSIAEEEKKGSFFLLQHFSQK